VSGRGGKCESVLVTGASGFIGSRLCGVAGEMGLQVTPVSRQTVGSIGRDTDWTSVLRKGSTVVHLAARAHIRTDDGEGGESLFRAVNVEGTGRLASEAARAGIKRLVFVSSIGVLGANTNGRCAFTAGDSPAPVEAYGRSKLEAEHVLREVEARTGLEVTIIRPPLVYGPNAPGNFGRLLELVRRGMPLPLGALQNRRSLVALDNLVDLISVCVTHPAAAGGTFLVADGAAVSTPELIRGIAGAMGRRARLVPVPVGVLRLAGRALGKSAEVERLVGSLEVDITHTCDTLGWAPPIDIREGLRRAVQC
jgi:nucleoside-diphosphate-sugar epimerase